MTHDNKIQASFHAYDADEVYMYSSAPDLVEAIESFHSWLDVVAKNSPKANNEAVYDAETTNRIKLRLESMLTCVLELG